MDLVYLGLGILLILLSFGFIVVLDRMMPAQGDKR